MAWCADDRAVEASPFARYSWQEDNNSAGLQVFFQSMKRNNSAWMRDSIVATWQEGALDDGNDEIENNDYCRTQSMYSIITEDRRSPSCDTDQYSDLTEGSTTDANVDGDDAWYITSKFSDS